MAYRVSGLMHNGILGLCFLAMMASAGQAIEGDRVRGQQLWLLDFGCTECHGPEEDKDEPLPVPYDVSAGFYDRGEGVMDIFSDITERDMADIRAYLKSIEP